uniref:Uncharacterized protein n=1 Tax=Cacopsylla melanoneura TaxID=428564 RepID=A0A8D8RMZ1_9HEMI
MMLNIIMRMFLRFRMNNLSHNIHLVTSCITCKTELVNCNIVCRRCRAQLGSLSVSVLKFVCSGVRRVGAVLLSKSLPTNLKLLNSYYYPSLSLSLSLSLSF